MPGSPSSVTAAIRSFADRISWANAVSSAPSPDDRAAGASHLDGQRALRLHERVEDVPVGRSDGCARLSSCDLAQHAADYGAAWAKVTPLQGHL